MGSSVFNEKFALSAENLKNKINLNVELRKLQSGNQYILSRELDMEKLLEFLADVDLGKTRMK